MNALYSVLHMAATGLAVMCFGTLAFWVVAAIWHDCFAPSTRETPRDTDPSA